MRISDWSSDVCSSDLLAEGVVGFFLRHFGEVRAAGDACAQGVDPGLGRGGVAVAVLAHQDVARAVLGDALCRRLVGAANVAQLQQLEAAGAAARAEQLYLPPGEGGVGEMDRGGGG